ncbi:amidase [Leifsonia sp. TF02-11]|uniref:amidase n=1 Tax=Leifsonia sp. TF02-11 TaxID=2815212 RepID=UPI001AA0F6D0|nr:amidase [Leifsonia sp. TF02-11]MBO1739376.1 amidase [Leifsonia sp. TF02-11]
MTGDRVTLQSIAERLRSAELTSRELVESVIRRSDASDLGAVVSLRADEALREADQLDAALRAGVPVGPLAGIPFLVKDLDDVAGMRTSHGSLWFEGAPPSTADSLVVRRLRAAGAIPVGKTNLPEFASEGFTDNPVHGVTRNPWDPELSPGGSSGGSAAALSAGIAPIATSTDGGGSARMPAAFCGLVGMKPTNGLIGQSHVPDWIDFSTDGVMTTTVPDLRLQLELIAGPVAGDDRALPTELPPARMPRRLIAADRTDDLGPLPAEVAEVFHTAVDELSALLRIPVEWRTSDSFFAGGSPDNDWFTLATAEHAHRWGRERIVADAARLHPNTLEFFRAGLSVTVDEYIAARRRRADYIRELDEALQGDALLLTPTVAVKGFSAHGSLGDGPEGLLPPSVYSTAIQNMTGLPALSLPAGSYSDGFPFGLQLTGPRWSDRMLLDVGDLWERAFPWPQVAPGYEPFAGVGQ